MIDTTVKRRKTPGGRKVDGGERGKLLAGYRRDMAAHCILIVDGHSVLVEQRSR